jgi:hypothetical protein
MTRVGSTEEPCAAKGARTVLETSGGSDPLTEFNRSRRFAGLGRKRMQGTYTEKVVVLDCGANLSPLSVILCPEA